MIQYSLLLPPPQVETSISAPSRLLLQHVPPYTTLASDSCFTTRSAWCNVTNVSRCFPRGLQSNRRLDGSLLQKYKKRTQGSRKKSEKEGTVDSGYIIKQTLSIVELTGVFELR